MVSYATQREKTRNIMEDLINEAVTEVVTKTAAETSERKDIECAQKLIQFGALSLEDIAKLTNLPLERIREIAGQANL